MVHIFFVLWVCVCKIRFIHIAKEYNCLSPIWGYLEKLMCAGIAARLHKKLK